MPPQTDQTPLPTRLEHFPISIFGMTMGLFGLTLALRTGGFGLTATIAAVIATGVLILLGGFFALKAVRHPGSVVAEWAHPVRMAFFPAISISLMLLAAFLRETNPGLAAPIWIIGALGQAVLTLAVINTWISHRAFGPGQLSPAWFIPAVGNLIAPLAGAELGFVELSWYFFATGLIFWIVLLTLVFNRLVFHDPLPGKLRPTLVILVAPPSVGFLSWLLLNGGEVDSFARVLLNIGYFFTALIALQIPALAKLPFALSFWALSFPLAAITTASFRYGALVDSGFHRALGYGLLVVLVLTILGLIARTIRAAMANEICQPE
ncbi:SLAC1 anion channel family protein [Oceaniglobus ichthyenteri]|uniref:SLAC1 anion channel family protein n=1 Tax=Oceaniglobus ichthyenteri TaxID=2136177 RepID=UPI000D3B7954|nr:SLAC1 anion channel family protein [Oceaniglobus ichthyenteri]